MRAITAFKVIQGHRGRCQSKVRMRFLVTNILSRTVSELSQLIVQISLQRGHFDSKFQVEGVVSPPIIFAWIVRPMNALQLCPRQFSHRCYGWGAM